MINVKIVMIMTTPQMIMITITIMMTITMMIRSVIISTTN